MDFGMVLHSAPVLLKALTQTLLLSLASAAIATVLGSVIAELQRLRWAPLSWVLSRYNDTVRGCPPLVFIFLVYYLLPFIGLQTSKFASATIAIALYFSGFVSEALRGAVESIPSGQIQAGTALGMRGLQIETIVVLPQALRVALPTLVNLSAILVKVTSLASVIGVWELTMATREIVTRTVRPFEYFTVAFFLYFLVCYGLAYLSGYLERRLGRGYL